MLELLRFLPLDPQFLTHNSGYYGVSAEGILLGLLLSLVLLLKVVVEVLDLRLA